jgi:hypothetical protein
VADASAEDAWLPTALIALAAVTLAQAMQISNSNFHPNALFWLTVSIAVMAGSMLVARKSPFGDRPTVAILLLGLGLQFQKLLTMPLALTIRLDELSQHLFTVHDRITPS